LFPSGPDVRSHEDYQLPPSTVIRHVNVTVPTIMPVIDRVITMPVLHMAGGHMNINRPGNDHGRGPNHDRVGINDRRLRIWAKVNTAVKPRLGNTDGHAYIGGLR
jgi:hypothetical protein